MSNTAAEAVLDLQKIELDIGIRFNKFKDCWNLRLYPVDENAVNASTAMMDVVRGGVSNLGKMAGDGMKSALRWTSKSRHFIEVQGSEGETLGDFSIFRNFYISFGYFSIMNELGKIYNGDCSDF